MKRIRAGYYREEANTLIDGKLETVTVEIQRYDRLGGWAYTITQETPLHVRTLADMDELYSTKRETIQALQEALDIGFRYHCHLGWCLDE